MRKNAVEQINEEDAKKVLAKFQEKGEKIAENKEELSDLVSRVETKSKENMELQATGPVKELLENIKLLISLIKDYINGSYKTIAIGSIIVIIGALLYFVSPVDLIPDVFPIIGSVDDIMVVGFAMTQVAADLAQYREWKEQQISLAENDDSN